MQQRSKIWQSLPLTLAMESFIFVLESVSISVFELQLLNSEEELLFTVFQSLLVMTIMTCFCSLFQKRGLHLTYIQKNLPLMIIGSFGLFIFMTLMRFIIQEQKNMHRYDLVIGLCICTLILILIFISLLILAEKKEALSVRERYNNLALEQTKAYCCMLLDKDKETKAFRHDIKAHIFSMKKLYEEGKYLELGTYLNEISKNSMALSPEIVTGSDIVNAIFNDLMQKYPDTKVKWCGYLDPGNTLSDYDQCTIFYNLLVNAFEAASNAAKSFVSVDVRYLNNTMVLNISNSFTKLPAKFNGRFISGKAEADHGYGYENASKCVINHGGFIKTVIDQHLFTVNIILP